MSNERSKRDSMSIEEETVSNMWEIAAIVEFQEQEARDVSTAVDSIARHVMGSWLCRENHAHFQWRTE